MSAKEADLGKLTDLVGRLRGPDGCPWDREQELGEVRAYLLEEAHELAAAIDGGDWGELAEELGDLLFQAAFIARLGEEAGALDLGQVIDGVRRKMVARHPHVFGGETLADAQAVRAAWERRKLEQEPRRASLLGGVPASLPALAAAYRLTQKAAGVGFDWPDAQAVLVKADEEIGELRQALAAADAPRGAPAISRGGSAAAAGQPALAAAGGSVKTNEAAAREELGDLLFTIANLCRKLELDPEAALAAANLKFRRRFAQVEAGLAAQGKPLGEASLAEMDQLWEAAKERERRGLPPESPGNREENQRDESGGRS
ncbi:MAG TPA: nucleoside triphosphate pyrophosphohydrolase [Thermoanaerobaculia bacterium]|nr:nucleoside triphosphate pyrophosphohydrolase [Thermoanaerobaculia bacterium]